MCFRAEFPRPQFCRENWQNLNGRWDFEIDYGNSGVERKLFDPAYKLSGHIQVPFCPESELSGVHHTDFMQSVWYKRDLVISAEQLRGCVLLHFGAVDYLCTVYINGKEIGTHKGGYSSFAFDITGALCAGTNQITVHAVDDVRDPMVPRGKQCETYDSRVCDYTRTTGIWQTVWLEFLPRVHIESVRYDTDIRGSVTMTLELNGVAELDVLVTYKGREMAHKNLSCCGGREVFTLNLLETHLWEIGHGRLYDVQLSYGQDTVKSYFGLRSVRLDGKKFLLNEKSVFQRLILDQGFYPDGIYTAPSDEALQKDIDLALAMGFNGARLHQKVFEERFLYHCDRKGYIVWGEYGSWGLDYTDRNAIYSILPEWMEVIKRDCNHPAVVCWCPYNETWQHPGKGFPCNEGIAMVYEVTKAMDPTRPCVDTSGGYHVKTDIFDIHDYQSDPAVFAGFFEKLPAEDVFENFCNVHQTYRGEAVMVSEYGGIRWFGNAQASDAWGYGDVPKTEEAFLARFKGLTDVLIDNPAMLGLCYTQLTDIEQEQNGLYTYDRKPKFDPETIRKIISRKAAIED